MEINQSAPPTRGIVSSVAGCYCPRCREGKLFKEDLSFRLKNVLVMNKTCPVCGQPTEIEVGFYYGTGYVSYGLTVVLSFISLVAWWLTLGLSTMDNRFFWWLGFNAVLLIFLQPWLMRISRSIWITCFVSYDPHWKVKEIEDFERIVPGQMQG
ncbi:MAG TPA: DUF983 domain-containing protein [Chitinophagaceae bacterium]